MWHRVQVANNITLALLVHFKQIAEISIVNVVLRIMSKVQIQLMTVTKTEYLFGIKKNIDSPKDTICPGIIIKFYPKSIGCNKRNYHRERIISHHQI